MTLMRIGNLLELGAPYRQTKPAPQPWWFFTLRWVFQHHNRDNSWIFEKSPGVLHMSYSYTRPRSVVQFPIRTDSQQFWLLSRPSRGRGGHPASEHETTWQRQTSKVGDSRKGDSQLQTIGSEAATFANLTLQKWRIHRTKVGCWAGSGYSWEVTETRL